MQPNLRLFLNPRLQIDRTCFHYRTYKSGNNRSLPVLRHQEYHIADPLRILAMPLNRSGNVYHNPSIRLLHPRPRRGHNFGVHKAGFPSHRILLYRRFPFLRHQAKGLQFPNRRYKQNSSFGYFLSICYFRPRNL